MSAIFAGAGNLPDGCTDSMLPHNSLAAIHQAAQWERNQAWVEQQARSQLRVFCGRQGEVSAAYLDHVTDAGICNHAQFVLMLERTNNDLWVRTVDRIWQKQFGAE